ncbi:MAG: co-chaperone GroES family protein [Rhodospirillales bacterium]
MTSNSGLIMPDTDLVVPLSHADAEPPVKTMQRCMTWDEDGVSLDQIPRPVGWRILVQPLEVAEVTSSGIYLPDETKDAQHHLNYVGKVVALGDAAYKHRKFEGAEPWVKPGDWVVHGRYCGQEIIVSGKKTDHRFRFVNDDDILAVAEHPERLVIYAGIA